MLTIFDDVDIFEDVDIVDNVCVIFHLSSAEYLPITNVN